MIIVLILMMGMMGIKLKIMILRKRLIVMDFQIARNVRWISVHSVLGGIGRNIGRGSVFCQLGVNANKGVICARRINVSPVHKATLPKVSRLVEAVLLCLQGTHKAYVRLFKETAQHIQIVKHVY